MFPRGSSRVPMPFPPVRGAEDVHISAQVPASLDVAMPTSSNASAPYSTLTTQYRSWQNSTNPTLKRKRLKSMTW